MTKVDFKEEKGFIAIIALGIFMMLSIFGIIVQRVTMDTIYNVSTTNKYNEASDIANSVMEYLRYEMNMHEAGYNFEVPCVYEEGGGGQTNDPNCDVVAYSLGLTDKNVEITMEIKGRSEIGEGFSGCFGITYGECFVVPLLGTGDAGDRCRMYEPTDDPEAIVDHKGQVSTSNPEGIRQLDYSCNWNKLAFGSSSTDRVAIPFYYDNGGTAPNNITNPFASLVDPATAFYVRIRPPCKPCESRQYPCEPGDDETICEEIDRYVLEDGQYTTGENDIIVQWQLSGECAGEECGLIQYVEYDQSGEIEEFESSAITEVKVNGEWIIPNNLILFSAISSKGIDINTYDESNPTTINTMLQTMQKPILTLFLSEKLISEDGNNIPYLEYQILTDKPIGSPKTKAEAIVNMDGYVFEKILYKEEQKSLIDFAVQN